MPYCWQDHIQEIVVNIQTLYLLGRDNGIFLIGIILENKGMFYNRDYVAFRVSREYGNSFKLG